jgi:hypothetical protein
MSAYLDEWRIRREGGYVELQYEDAAHERPYGSQVVRSAFAATVFYSKASAESWMRQNDELELTPKTI